MDVLPIEPGVVEPGEPLIVTITGVEEELWMVWDTDGTIWLVPGYAFTDDEGGRYSVPAIPDEFLAIQDPVPTPEPVPVETVPAEETPVTPLPEEPPVEETATDLPVEGGIASLVGMTEADAMALIESVGWTSRISARDGEYFALTMDLRMDRVNLEIADGLVTVATIG